MMVLLGMIAATFKSVDAHNYEECSIVPTQNTMTIITSIAGVLGLIVCIAVLLVIFAYRKDKQFLRERIIAGLAIANALYAFICIIPLQYYKADCTSLIDISVTGTFRIVWFGTKYLVCCYENFIIFVTIYVLLRGGKEQIPKAVEIAAHVVCWVSAVAVIIPSSIRAQAIIKPWKALQDQMGAIANDPSQDETFKLLNYESFIYEEQWNTLISAITDGWFVVFGLALLSWVIMRIILWQKQKDWMTAYNFRSKQWERDNWENSDQDVRLMHQQKTLLNMERQSYRDIAEPLERYVFVFLMFLPPAIVIATDFCSANSENKDTTCQVPCEMILAFRSLASSLVYFTIKENRQQLYNWRNIPQKLLSRTKRSLKQKRQGSNKSLNRVNFSSENEVNLVDNISQPWVCTYTGPRGDCVVELDSPSITFCDRHACPRQGCEEAKASRDKDCGRHQILDTNTDANVDDTAVAPSLPYELLTDE